MFIGIYLGFQVSVYRTLGPLVQSSFFAGEMDYQLNLAKTDCAKIVFDHSNTPKCLRLSREARTRSLNEFHPTTA